MISVQLTDFSVTDEDGRNTVDYVFDLWAQRDSDTAWETDRLTYFRMVVHLPNWNVPLEHRDYETDKALLAMLDRWLAESPVLIARFQEACDAAWVAELDYRAECRAERRREQLEGR